MLFIVHELKKRIQGDWDFLGFRGTLHEGGVDRRIGNGGMAKIHGG